MLNDKSLILNLNKSLLQIYYIRETVFNAK